MMGVLRAYANRAMVLAFLCIPITMLALAFAVYVRLQPPTVIRVDETRPGDGSWAYTNRLFQ